MSISLNFLLNVATELVQDYVKQEAQLSQ